MTMDTSTASFENAPVAERTDPVDKQTPGLFFRRCRKADATAVTSHWGHLIENFGFSSHEFYQRVEQALQLRQIPELMASRVVWNQGGFLSPRREYLRIQRGQSVFDICAAPFGTGFFVTSWAGDKPLRLGWLLILLLLLLLFGYNELVDVSAPSSQPQLANWQYPPSSRQWEPPGIRRPPGFFRTIAPQLDPDLLRYALTVSLIMCLIGILVLVAYFPDASLLRIPVVGYVYARYFRKITYYRMDVHACYEKAVHAAVVEVIDDLIKTHGLRPLSEQERAPNYRDFFSTLMPHAARR